jgi:splicing factor 3B subunit 5
MQASDRFNINSQLEHLQAKYVGTGHADVNRFEWAVNIQRDSYASYVGHYPILAYFAIAENESIGRERYNFMQVNCCVCCICMLHNDMWPCSEICQVFI